MKKLSLLVLQKNMFFIKWKFIIKHQLYKIKKKLIHTLASNLNLFRAYFFNSVFFSFDFPCILFTNLILHYQIFVSDAGPFIKNNFFHNTNTNIFYILSI